MDGSCGSWESSSYNSRFNGPVQDKMDSQLQISDLFELQGDSYLECEFPEFHINGADLTPAGTSSGFMQTSISSELVAARDVTSSKTKHRTGIEASEINHIDPNSDRAPGSFLAMNRSSWQASGVRKAKKRKAFSSKTSMVDNNLSPCGDALYRTQTQRSNHIMAERHRREDMNEKFSILRTILPKITKKDKASIVTDTINYVSELEKKVRQLEDFKSRTSRKGSRKNYSNGSHEKLEIKLNHNPDIEIQSMGNRAVIQVMCPRRSRGLLLRTVEALDDCKADVLQSNMITLGNITLQYFTVQLIPGVTASDDEIIGALEEATR